jgi:chemotaxis protein methyltransferase CheR
MPTEPAVEKPDPPNADPIRPSSVAANISNEQYAAFQDFLEESAGIVLGENKHYLVTSRLSRVMQDNKLASYNDLLARVAKDPRFRELVIDAMTTNETSWFRDTHPFDILKAHVLPVLAKKNGGPIRIWSSACSTGQEPYSLSICIQEFMTSSPGMLRREVEIVATDISPSSIDEAKTGVYDDISMARGLSQDRRNRFFQKRDDQWEVRKDVKARVTFRHLNLLQGFSSLGKFDLILCRNVLIYFSTGLKSNVLQRMVDTLVPGGFLILGGTETMSNYSDAFQMIRLPNGVIYQLKSRE